MLQRLLRPAIGIWNYALYVNQMKARLLSDNDISMPNKLCETIQFGLDYTSNPYQKEIVQSFIQGALLGLCGILSEEKSGCQPPRLPQRLVLRQIRQATSRLDTDGTPQ